MTIGGVTREERVPHIEDRKKENDRWNLIQAIALVHAQWVEEQPGGPGWEATTPC